MSTVTITTENGKTCVESPYHPDWPSEARNLGGKWSGGVWVFDARDESRVRELAREVYGTDGTPDPGGNVTVRIPLVVDVRGPGNGRPATLYRYGRTIATRFGRDEEPRLGDGVILVEGGFTGSAGSRSYIELGPLDGTVVEVRDVPRSLAEEHGLEIVEDDKPDPHTLRAERERLVARIAEIDALLDA
ncbi:hypothetical protein ACIQU6_30565 [Streptomyces sp. NPDC090442]|uniref:hypothetical protein n=1 Tax=Streptomyces sp. NPDC090442 TaxID=3365962 RepID=UPI0037FE4A52